MTFFSQRPILNLKLFQVNFPWQNKVPTLKPVTVITPAFLPQVFFGEMLTQPFNCCCNTLVEIYKLFKVVESIVSSSHVFSHIISIYKTSN